MSQPQRPDRLPPPFGEFLRAIDVVAPEAVDLHCIGGFAVSAYYGLDRPTGDVDICNAVPHSAAAWLVALAGAGTALHRRYGLYLQYATVAMMPYHYEERLQVLFPGVFTRLRLLIPDPIDLALSKLSRNTEIDRADVLHLAADPAFDLAALEQRYRSELRAYLHGDLRRHDATIDLWREMVRAASYG